MIVHTAGKLWLLFDLKQGSKIMGIHRLSTLLHQEEVSKLDALSPAKHMKSEISCIMNAHISKSLQVSVLCETLFIYYFFKFFSCKAKLKVDEVQMLIFGFSSQTILTSCKVSMYILCYL